MRRILLVPPISALLFSCQPPAPTTVPDAAPSTTAASQTTPSTVATTTPATTTTPYTPAAPVDGRKPDVPPVKAESGPAASPRLPPAPAGELSTKIQNFFAGNVGRRIHIQVDKPLYQPGETIWIKTWDLAASTLVGPQGQSGITYEFVSPKGAVVLSKRVQEAAGLANNDFEIPAEVQGGEYIIRARADDGIQAERPVIVNAYEAPRIKKKLEWVKKAYGAGDVASATIEVKRPTGEPLGNKQLTAVIRLDGVELPRVQLTTAANGEGLVRFQLPKEIAVGDGLLTVLVEDGGVTESVSKSIPIILKKLQFNFFPEGGHLISGLESRVYFEAKNMLNKPADVEGRIVDDVGNAVATFSTYKNGMGRVVFTPGTGRSYKAQITRPVGVTETYPLPLADAEGCVLRTFDDLDGDVPELRARVTCSSKRAVTVVGVVRERVLDVAAVEVPDAGAVVHLKSGDKALNTAQGVVRVTVLDENKNPLAERVVFRNRRAGLRVAVQTQKPSYSPREQVVLNVTTTDATGAPRPAELAMSVVDDTVISFADDKTGHMLSRLFLEPEVPGTVEEPNFYFDLTEEKSALAMELLMGTRGWRTFEWQKVLNPPPPQVAQAKGGGFGGRRGDVLGAMPEEEGGMADMAVRRRAPAAAPPPAEAPQAAAPPPPAAPGMMDDRKEAARPAKQEAKRDVANAPARQAAEPERKAKEAAPAQARNEVGAAKKALAQPVVAGRMQGAAALAMDEAQQKPMAEEAMARDKDWAGAKVAADQLEQAYAPVRVFPAPTYGGDYDGARTDFRETIHFQPVVRTGKDGKATITFYASDAVTSFRVFTEGVGGGLAGRDETVFKSNLPFSMSVKLPVEVSAGDRLLLPLTLTNEKDKPLGIELDATFGPLLSLRESPLKGTPQLGAGQRQSLFFPVDVTGMQGKSRVAFHAMAGGLKDEFAREVTVTPRGFPQVLSQSGKVQQSGALEFDVGDVVPGSVDASIRFYASPVATMVGGLEGMLQEPSGCFEQTSSTNYPNVMIMQYLRESPTVDSAIVERANKLMDSGYKRLTAYETPQKGYEWFGGAPAHEALTAYGLVEFTDMKEVYPDVDDSMVRRTAEFLKGRRDGKGGFQRDPKALDSFGGASPAVTNAYITWSLSEVKAQGFDAEYGATAALAQSTQDAYLLALATNTLFNLPSHKQDAVAAAKRLAGMQDNDGAWRKAEHSITRSTGDNLFIETTALSVLAFIKEGGHKSETAKAMTWLMEHRGGFGQWGATQATVLALKAMTQYARANRTTQSNGSVVVSVNGHEVATQAYEAGRKEPLVFAELGRFFKPGKNQVSIKHNGKEELPFTAAVEYRTVKPASSEACVVNLATTMDKSTVKLGETVRLTAVVTNKTQAGQPMTLARIGFPGGLQAQTWQLKELKDKGLIGFFETRPREVILYFRDMKPGEVKTIPLDLVSVVPGEFMGPASSAYLYYTNDHRTWVDGSKLAITP